MVISVGVWAQDEYRFSIGTSLTYIGERDDLTYYDYDEFTWNINASVRIGKRFHLGVQALSIFADGGNTGYDYYHIVGSMLQFDFYHKKSKRFFLETSINKGDFYFPNSDPYPSSKSGLAYIGWGAGGEIPLFKDQRIFLDLSFICYSIIDQPENTIGFTQYIIGLNYKFGR